MDNVEAIALKSEQMSGLSGDYQKSKPQSINNANVLSDGLNIVAPSQTTNKQVISPNINMEENSVNMNLSPELGVVNNSVTDQVFGIPVTGESVIPEAPIFSTPSSDSTLINSSYNFNDSIPSVPFQEPSMTNSGIGEKLDNDDAFEFCNSLRNDATIFYNDFIAKIDKFQEQIMQKQSGISLVSNSSPIIKENLNTNDNVQMSNVNYFDVPQIQPQTIEHPQTNYDQTIVIPRDVMNNAISEMETGMKKAA